MPAIRKFEDIQAWQEARRLTKLIYSLTSQGGWSRDYGLQDQIRRAAVSVMSNIAEGFGRDSDVEFRRFLVIARGSAAEVKSQLYIAHDLGYVSAEAFSSAYDLTDKTARMIGSLMRYLKTDNASVAQVTRRRADAQT